MNSDELLHMKALELASQAPNAHSHADVLRIAKEYLNFLKGNAQ